ncbi:5'-methylthioadenosine/S-adenosylhomocysteine nucleosidase [Pasteurellaceae bacterium Macca]|nr:5'-methylthioadenosine/S-adenosylhomocysteine nucleosidase [Pasteurellaceae bacterium Macca]
MKVGIIGAMAQEVAILAGQMQAPQMIEIAGGKIYQGKIDGVDVALLQSGIGKTAAAVGTALLLELAKPDLIINTGSAGGLAPTLNVGDIVVSTEVCHHDVDVTAFGYAKGQLPANPATFLSDQSLVELATQKATEASVNVVSGLIGSGDQFINSQEKIDRLRHDFPAIIAVEMEAASIAQVCHAFQVPFVVVRAISDVADKVSHLSFEEFLPLAAEKSSKIVLAMLKRWAS